MNQSYQKLAIHIAVMLISFLAPTAVFGEPFKVGVVVPLSGPYANFGEAARVGIELGSQNSATGRVKFLYEDSQYDAAYTRASLHSCALTLVRP